MIVRVVVPPADRVAAVMFTVAGANEERLMETTFVAAEPTGVTTSMASSDMRMRRVRRMA